MKDSMKTTIFLRRSTNLEEGKGRGEGEHIRQQDNSPPKNVSIIRMTSMGRNGVTLIHKAWC